MTMLYSDLLAGLRGGSLPMPGLGLGNAPDPFQMVADRFFDKKRDEWKTNPQKWAWERLGVFLWSMQAEIVSAIPIFRKVAVRSCHDSGKSFVAAIATAWWIDTHPPGSARVVTTAPTGDQVKGVLWNEIGKLKEMHAEGQTPLPGRINQTEWWLGNYQAAVGRKPSDYKPAAFQGYHAEYLLAILDEADGLPVEMWEAINTLATNEGSCVFAIGNPDDPASHFRRMQDDHTLPNVPPGPFKTFKISAWNTPNFSGEKVPALLTRVLLHPDWVEASRRLWGGKPDAKPGQEGYAPDHPSWLSKVEAEYPDNDAMTVIRAGDLARAIRGPEEPSKIVGQVQLGVDLGGSETGDESVIRLRVGKLLLGEWRMRSSDPAVLRDWIAKVAKATGATVIAYDANGIGFGFEALLREALPHLAILPVNVGAGSSRPQEFVNLRAELWWRMRLLCQNDKVDLSQAENIAELNAQLGAMRYGRQKQRILVEPKKEFKKRFGRSPDNADAAILACYVGSGGGPAVVTSAAGAVLPTGASGRRR